MYYPNFIIILLSLFSLSTLSQEVTEQEALVIDERYREDQFYIGIGYNLITEVPSELNIRGLSGGVHAGFIRDMPLNARRNIALGIGLGVAFDQYGQNLFIGEDQNDTTIFELLNENQVSFDTNRFSTAIVELPVEFRWRTSTSSSYKFWRIYTGVRIGYAYYYKASFSQSNNQVIQTDVPNFNKTRFTATLGFGYNKINFFAAYALHPFFEDAVTSDGVNINFQPLKLGFIFYIL